jgi:hypothetical protein
MTICELDMPISLHGGNSIVTTKYIKMNALPYSKPPACFQAYSMFLLVTGEQIGCLLYK